ncbi:hypothetical protein, partial [Pseudonocardia pini]|uniref:hypothetical protein n=1 Tax=Pseudonocardia pini TaxID=2758030 RepID=UPI0015F0520B
MTDVTPEATVALTNDPSTLPALIEVTPLRCGARLALRDGGAPATAEVRVTGDDRLEVLLESAGTRVAADLEWRVEGADRVLLTGTLDGEPFRFTMSTEAGSLSEGHTPGPEPVVAAPPS